MKKVILVLLTASTLISCATRERREATPGAIKRTRVYEVKNGYKQSVVELRYVDTMYRKGDTIMLGLSKFIIE